MNSTTRHPVVVGIDRSHYSRAALRYAAQMAHRQRRPLRVVHAFEPAHSSVRPLIGRSAELTDVFRNSAQRLCDEALETLAVAYADLEVSVRLEPGLVVETLLDESDGAEVMVLGRRGVGGFASLLLGSTTLQVTGHARCPVITVPKARDGEPPREGVVVGIDGSEISERAVEYAFRAASELDEKLILLHAWDDPATTMGIAMMAPGVYDSSWFESDAVLEVEEQLLLAESVAGWSEKYPDVHVERKVVRRHPVVALVEESASASLVVVGCRGQGTLRSMALGSVSHGVLHHASGPVAVVR
jgi:nucleotide-binding universal stress UspA family protein